MHCYVLFNSHACLQLQYNAPMKTKYLISPIKCTKNCCDCHNVEPYTGDCEFVIIDCSSNNKIPKHKKTSWLIPKKNQFSFHWIKPVPECEKKPDIKYYYEAIPLGVIHAQPNSKIRTVKF